MKLLLVVATPEEIKPLSAFFDFTSGPNIINGHEIFILTTGVGMVATAWRMGGELERNTYDIAINAGIAGSFNRSIQMGEVVKVEKDCFPELGAEDGSSFLSIDELGFGESEVYPIASEVIAEQTGHLRKVNGISVNTVHGCDSSIEKVALRLQPDIESMEGASFYYCCRMKSLPSLQIRSISNYVERRNRSSWNIPLAINNLNNELIGLLKNII